MSVGVNERIVFTGSAAAFAVGIVFLLLAAVGCAMRTGLPTAKKPVDLPRCQDSSRSNLVQSTPQNMTYKAAFWSFLDLRWRILTQDIETGAIHAKYCKMQDGKENCLTMNVRAQPDGVLRIESVGTDGALNNYYRDRWLAFFKQRYGQNSCYAEKHLEAKLVMSGYDVGAAEDQSPSEPAAAAESKTTQPAMCPPCRCYCLFSRNEITKSNESMADRHIADSAATTEQHPCPPCECHCVLVNQSESE